MITIILSSILLASAYLSDPGDVPVLSVPVRPASSVVIDGKFSEKEWEGAREITIAPQLTLLTFQTKDDVWMAIQLPKDSLCYVDMFLLAADGKRINLHASMQVGEREVPAKGWTDREPTTHWGKQDRWQANFVKQIPSKNDSAPPYEGFEFKLSKKRFEGQNWQMRLEVRDFGGKKEDLVFPKGSDRFTPSSWATISLDPLPANP